MKFDEINGYVTDSMKTVSKKGFTDSIESAIYGNLTSQKLKNEFMKIKNAYKGYNDGAHPDEVSLCVEKLKELKGKIDEIDSNVNQVVSKHPEIDKLRDEINNNLSGLISKANTFASEAEINELVNKINKLIENYKNQVAIVVNDTKKKDKNMSIVKNAKELLNIKPEKDVFKVTDSSLENEDTVKKAKDSSFYKKMLATVGAITLAGAILISMLNGKDKKTTNSNDANVTTNSNTISTEAPVPTATPYVVTETNENLIEFNSVTNQEELDEVTDYYFKHLVQEGYSISRDDVRDSIITLNGNGNLVTEKDYTMNDCVDFVDDVTNMNSDYNKEPISLAEMFTDDKADTQVLLNAIDDTVEAYQSGNKTKEALQELLDLTKAICVDDKYNNKAVEGAIFLGSNQFFAFGQEYRNYQDRNNMEFTTEDDIVDSITFDQVLDAANGVNNKDGELTVRQAATRTLGLSLEKRDCLK